MLCTMGVLNPDTGAAVFYILLISLCFEFDAISSRRIGKVGLNRDDRHHSRGGLFQTVPTVKSKIFRTLAGKNGKLINEDEVSIKSGDGSSELPVISNFTIFVNSPGSNEKLINVFRAAINPRQFHATDIRNGYTDKKNENMKGKKSRNPFIKKKRRRSYNGVFHGEVSNLFDKRRAKHLQRANVKNVTDKEIQGVRGSGGSVSNMTREYKRTELGQILKPNIEISVEIQHPATFYISSHDKTKYGNHRNPVPNVNGMMHGTDKNAIINANQHRSTHDKREEKLNRSTGQSASTSLAFDDASGEGDSDITAPDGAADAISNDSARKHDGVVPWPAWSSCSLTCGLGTQTRTRSCGEDCYETESRQCSKSCLDGKDNPFFYSEKTVAPKRQVDNHPEETSQFIDPEIDNCGKWLNCKSSHLVSSVSQLHSLPSCPCSFPHATNEGSVFDKEKNAYFSWKSIDSQHLKTFKPGAKYCIMSKIVAGSGSISSQECCFNDQELLITRGRDAGTPSLISPQISAALHYKVDILPWIICKGDWTRYNLARPPNNERGCPKNPRDAELQIQAEEARNF